MKIVIFRPFQADFGPKTSYYRPESDGNVQKMVTRYFGDTGKTLIITQSGFNGNNGLWGAIFDENRDFQANFGHKTSYYRPEADGNVWKMVRMYSGDTLETLIIIQSGFNGK